jgi:1-deoxy-D-xylulose-5-phosphate reductoisomerase
MKKGVAILGSTGSIGTQALEVIEANPSLFEIELLTSNNRYELLIEQARKFVPNAVVICDETKYLKVKEALSDLPVKVYSGLSSITQLMEMSAINIVLTAMVGYAGLEPTIAAIKNKKNIALANKETLVVAGELITKLAAENAVNIYPVDSEHSAIFQCLVGEFHNPVEKIYLTASGGPFRGKDAVFLATVTKEQALRHPNWAMGAKITIDSATLMNKGLEMIEAKWLFSLKPEQIDVIVHPQSIIHSIVQFTDGSMKAQMGLPDMKLPIQYALAYPQRISSAFPRFNFAAYPSLTFEEPDRKTFRCLTLAESALQKGGNTACVLNAANEVAVDAFLKDQVSFTGIPALIETCMEEISYKANPVYSDYIATDTETRIKAREFVRKNRQKA